MPPIGGPDTIIQNMPTEQTNVCMTLKLTLNIYFAWFFFSLYSYVDCIQKAFSLACCKRLFIYSDMENILLHSLLENLAKIFFHKSSRIKLN